MPFVFPRLLLMKEKTAKKIQEKKARKKVESRKAILNTSSGLAG